MATVIMVDGSAYRREGAKMLIDEDGKTYGMISGGCLEEDLTHHAKEVLKTNQPKIVTYDMKSENDLGWGQGAGCNGIIYVYIEATGWNFLKDRNGNPVWDLIDKKLSSGHRVASLLLLGVKENYNNRIYFSEDGDILYELENVKMSLLTELETFISHDKRTESIKTEAHGKVLLELYKPKALLFIFGAGPDIEPLVELAAKLDFSVSLIDPRSSRCNKKNFPTADQHIVEHSHMYLQNNEIPLNSFVLIMTHNFQWDQDVLKHLVTKSIRYLGILGPRRRTERLLYPEPIPLELHSPVGLDICAEGSEEIAVSICAELVKWRNSGISQ